jgi:peptidyl-prolyl cis-trans isomerase B (cyclophilin B)
MRARRHVMLLLSALVVLLSGCGGGSRHASSSQAATAPTPTNGTTAAGSTPAACRTAPVPAPKGPQHLRAPTLKLDPHRTYTVSVQTNCGNFAFTLDVRDSPKTSASFYSLVKRGFFDGLTFHRVAAGFVIQGGDPNGDGSGGPGYQVVEPPPRSVHYVRGDVAMAKTQADPAGASGSQFFVVTGADVTASAGLTPDYALVGKVVSGQQVVDAIGALPTNPPQDGQPTPAVIMSKVTVSVT